MLFKAYTFDLLFFTEMGKNKGKDTSKHGNQRIVPSRQQNQPVRYSKENKQEQIKIEKPEPEPPKPKFVWSYKNPKFRASLIFTFFVVFFLLVWKEPEVKSIDPWYEAYFLIDSSLKVADPAVKNQLMNDGGEKLRVLVKKYPYHAKVHLLLGVYYEVAGQWDSAIAEHKQSMKLGAGGTINPIEQDAARQLLICYLNKSNQLLQYGDFSGARKILDEAKAQRLNNPDLENQIGIIFHRQYERRGRPGREARTVRILGGSCSTSSLSYT